MTYVFPVTMLVLSAGASIIYASSGDWRRAVYWAACVVITVTVTMESK